MATVTTEQVEARVVETLATFGPEADQINRSSTFEELDIDSLDLVELPRSSRTTTAWSSRVRT